MSARILCGSVRSKNPRSKLRGFDQANLPSPDIFGLTLQPTDPKQVEASFVVSDPMRLKIRLAEERRARQTHAE